jgi:hypothetical protein
MNKRTRFLLPVAALGASAALLARSAARTQAGA